MNFISSLGDKTKNTLLKSIASLLEKNPQENLTKIIKLSKLLAVDQSSIEKIDSFEASYNNIPDFKNYVDDMIEHTDHKIMKNFVVNILGSNLSHKKKYSSVTAQSPRSLMIDCDVFKSNNSSLNFTKLDKIISESRKIGVFTFIITGVSPLSSDFLYKIYEKYSDSLFIPVADKNNVTHNVCQKIIECGNIFPMFQHNSTNINILKNNGIPVFNMPHIQKLLSKVDYGTELSHLKTFSLEFNEFSINKLKTCSLSDLISKNAV